MIWWALVALNAFDSALIVGALGQLMTKVGFCIIRDNERMFFQCSWRQTGILQKHLQIPHETEMILS